MNDETDPHARFSSQREQIVEHLFLGELLRLLWRHGIYEVEVSRAETDAFGYDVVVECKGVIRHIQLKANLQEGKPISVARALAAKAGGCVIWLQVTRELNFVSFKWFGGEPLVPLPLLESFGASRRPGGHGRRRENHVDVPLSRFEQLEDMKSVVYKLFGDILRDTPSKQS